MLSGTFPGTASGVGGIEDGDCSNCSGGGSGLGVCVSGGVWEGGCGLSGGKGGMFDEGGVFGNWGGGVTGLGA